MDISKLEPNSHKYNQSKSDAKVFEEKTEIKKVVNGKVMSKKRSVGKRLGEIFFSDDAPNVKEYLIYDVLIPTIKDGFVDLIQKGTEMLFYGHVRSKSRPGNGSFVSYGNYSKSSNQRPEPRHRSLYSYNDIVLENRAEAEDVLSMMCEIIDKYGQVTVADYYETVGVTGNGYTDNNYGWTDLKDTYISRCRDGYMINLPRCVDIR